MKRSFLKEKEARKLLSALSKRMRTPLRQIQIAAKPLIELVEANGEAVFLVNKEPVFAKSKNELFPTLSSSALMSNLPRVIVNMGAVPYVCNGADVMAPGIVSFEEDFEQNDIVAILDERHKKPIAVTVALYSMEEAKELGRGKVLVNLHYVGDKLWEMIKQLKQGKNRF